MSGPLSVAESGRVEGWTSRAVHGAALVALFVGALVANLHRAGTSPIVWLDTVNDSAYVDQCLRNGACTLTGVATSVPGRVHGVAWLEMRSLLAYLGADLDAVHVILQILDALAVVLTFELARRLGGPLAGVAAAYAMAVGMNEGVRVAALYNTSVLAFLGTVLVVACTAAIDRTDDVALGLAALVAAVMANVHIGCLIAGVSVLWVSLVPPSRRLRRLAVGFAVFALATFCIAPPSWLQNVASLVDGQTRPRMPGGGMDTVSTIRLTAVGVGAWVLSMLGRSAVWTIYRRRIQGALAVAVPVAIGSYVWPLFGMEANVKYLAHIASAAAVAAGVPIGMAASALVRSLLGGTRALPVLRAIEATAPFALALVLPGATPGLTERMPTVHDLAAVADVLHRDYGWDAADMIERVKTPDGVSVLSALEKVPAMPGRVARADRATSTTALLVTVDDEDLPTPVPQNWNVIRKTSATATVLVSFGSRVDWHAFEVCTESDNGGDRRCASSGYERNDTPVFAVRNMPPPGLQSRGRLTMHLTVRPGAAEEAIFMPRLPQTCGGWVVDDHDPAVRVAADRRHAIVAGSDASPTTLTLAWQIGAPECRGWAYDGLPPFVVVGDARAVASIEPALHDREF